MLEENKETVRRIPEEITTLGKLELIDELFAPDFVDHSFSPALGLAAGREGIRQYINMVRTGFPDVDLKVQQIVAEGEMVAVRSVGRGTHTGEFMGIAPTGNQVTWTETHIVRMVNGRVTEHWADADRLGMMQQLGVIPAD